MIRLQRITTADHTLYNYMEQLLVKSFPAEEYRPLKDLRQYSDSKKLFHNHAILHNEIPIGLLTYWDFNAFLYIEHFAIDPSMRSGGYGQRVLQHLFQTTNVPIVLEVEEPTEEMAQRRIGFYQRQGFILWKKPYLQPPYKPGDTFLPMLLMAYGNLQCEKDFDEVKNQIYREVYNVT